MFSYKPPEVDLQWAQWDSSLHELFATLVTQQLDTIYECDCNVMSNTTEQQHQKKDVLVFLPVPRHLEEEQRLLQGREPVLELASQKTTNSLLDHYTRGTDAAADRKPCASCSAKPKVRNTQTLVPIGTMWLLCLKRMDYLREANAAIKVRMRIVPNLVIRAGHQADYHLRSVVVHRGEDTSRGHYVTYVVLAQPSQSGRSSRCYLYDDDNPVLVLDGFPGEVYTDAAMFVYSREPPQEGFELSKLHPTIDAAQRTAPVGRLNSRQRTKTTTESTQTIQTDMTRLYYMPEGEGQERVQKDARRLLTVYTDSLASAKDGSGAFASVTTFLQTLPRWVSEAGVTASLHEAPQRYDTFIQALLLDKVTSATALQTKPYTGDWFLYPFVVLMEATAIAESIPSTFFESSTMSTLGALLNKRAHIKLARYQTKSRPWCVMTASAGEGKSPSLKPLSAAATKAMEDERLEIFCEGDRHDSFHAMQSSTTAAAIHKLRSCNGYLWMRAGDAGRCLSQNQAIGRPVDASKHTDLEYFLDAAHGDEFFHQTMKTRDAMQKAESATRKANPKKPIPDVPDTNFDTRMSRSHSCSKTITP